MPEQTGGMTDQSSASEYTSRNRTTKVVALIVFITIITLVVFNQLSKNNSDLMVSEDQLEVLPEEYVPPIPEEELNALLPDPSTPEGEYARMSPDALPPTVVKERLSELEALETEKSTDASTPEEVQRKLDELDSLR